MNQKNIVFSNIAFIVLLLFAACSKKTAPIVNNDPIKQKVSDTCTMVVFIHGTILPMPSMISLSESMYESFAHGRTLNKSWYQLYLDALKLHTTYRFQPMGPDGLHPITNHPSSHITAEMYQDLSHTACSCYTFGWDGRLSHAGRVAAANELYHALVHEVAKHRRTHKYVELVLVGHSHGGNVALNLARAEEEFKKNLIIDKLILSGTPVQSETKKYATAPCFKHVYNFYSHSDSVQKMDIISTDDDWSARIFDHEKNITQVDLSCGRQKPGHCELWLFGCKKNMFCHRSISISPFPVFVFMPFIIEVLDTHFPKTSLVCLNIDKDKQGLSFLFSANKQKHTAVLDEAFLARYRTRVLNL